MRSVFSLPLCTLALTLLAGCNQSLDQKQLEKAISDKLKADKYPITSVTCPAAQPVKKDDKFTCTAKFEGDTTVPIEVKQTGEGNVEWEAKGILLVADFTQIVDKKTKEGDPKAVITCPSKTPVIVVKKDLTLNCSLKNESGTSDFVVTFKDDKGDWEHKFKDAAPAGTAAPAATGEPTAAPAATGEPAPGGEPTAAPAE